MDMSEDVFNLFVSTVKANKKEKKDEKDEEKPATTTASVRLPSKGGVTSSKKNEEDTQTTRRCNCVDFQAAGLC